MTAIYIDRYPEDGFSSILRGISLTSRGQADQGKAVMDSTIIAWRQGEDYQKFEKAQQYIDSQAYQFEALVADALNKHEVAAWNWQRAIDRMPDKTHHEQWYLHYRLAADQLVIGQVTEALAGIDPMLEVNPRLINVLVLKVQCHLALNEGAKARAALEQLQWSISKSDPDFPARLKAAEMEILVSSLAGAQ